MTRGRAAARCFVGPPGSPHRVGHARAVPSALDRDAGRDWHDPRVAWWDIVAAWLVDLLAMAVASGLM